MMRAAYRLERIAMLRRRIAHYTVHRQWQNKKECEALLRPLMIQQLTAEMRHDRKSNAAAQEPR